MKTQDKAQDKTQTLIDSFKDFKEKTVAVEMTKEAYFLPLSKGELEGV